MSENDTSEQESDGESECPAEDCDYTSESKRSTLAHFGSAHSDEVKQEIYLKELNRLADELGHTPAAADMAEHGRFGSMAYVSQFGSWNEALEVAGFCINRQGQLSDGDLIEELRRLAGEVGHTPSYDDMAETGAFSPGVYETRFGSWNEAVEAAELEPNEYHNIPEGELVDEIRRLANELGHTPNNTDMTESGEFSCGAYHRCFGSWNAALEAAGHEPNNRCNIPDDELLEELRRLAEKLDRTPHRKDMADQGEFSPSVYSRRFGGWNAALKKVGVEPVYRSNISDDELIEELQRLSNELDRTPSYHDMTEFGKFSTGPYQARFGTWNTAVKAADLNPNVRRDIPEEELLEEIHRLSDELDRTPRFDDMDEYGAFSPQTYQANFGTWNAALKEAGFDLTDRVNIPEEEILEELQRLADELDRTPSGEDMVVSGKFGIKTYTRRFGTWHAAVEEIGLDPLSPEDFIVSGEDHHFWNGGRVSVKCAWCGEPKLVWPSAADRTDHHFCTPDDGSYASDCRKQWRSENFSGENHPTYNGGRFPYGLGWNETKKEEVRERDGRKCQHCGRSEKEHIEIHGTKQAVHHIQKARAVDNPSQRNSMKNLVTLCRVAPQNGDKPCHDVWEAMSPLRPDTI